MLREGGLSNVKSFLELVESVIENKSINSNHIKINKLENPALWDWQNEPGEKVGLLFYKSSFSEIFTNI